jgi:hypothetical protein
MAAGREAAQVLTDNPGKFAPPVVTSLGNSYVAHLSLKIVEIDSLDRGL